MTLYLLNFKNYFNREIEVCGTHAGDYTKLYGYINIINNMSLWNPNDGVNTVVTTCWNVNTIPNYVLVCPDGDDEIQSRWWVIKHERIAGTQYRLYLRRDLIADNLDMVLNSTSSYIFRGYCDDNSDLIYNDEGLGHNEIKTAQYALTDDTNVPWIVIYVKTPPAAFDEATNKYSVNWGAEEGMYPFTDVDQSQYICHFFWRHDTQGSENTFYYNQKVRYPNDVPYVAFTVPMSNVMVQKYKPDSTSETGMTEDEVITIYKDDVLRYTNMICRLLGDNVMDIQILPFCPLVNSQTRRGVPFIDPELYKSFGGLRMMTYYPNDSTKTGFEKLFLPRVETLKGTRQLWFMDEGIAHYKVEDIKQTKCMNTFRLCSPNGSSVWEFNPADITYKSTEGDTDTVYFWCDYTLIPYQPYINVRPTFDRLYGKKFKDYRGLICSGDFSMPQVSDAWISYVQSNKNYSASFQRNVESLELQSKNALAGDIASAVAGVATGAASGAIAGSIVPGVGTVAGAVVGGVASLGAGVADIITNSNQRKDSIDNAIDQHNYEMGNIQAKPTTVSDVAYYNIDNVMFPTLEIYSASRSDIERYEKYIKEKGYTINAYGPLSAYLKEGSLWFYSLAILRAGYTANADITFIGDSEELSQLADECKRGFYYKA